MLRIAAALSSLGHQVVIYTMSWEGELPEGKIQVKLISPKGLLNYKRYQHFALQSQQDIKQTGFDLVVGFNRMAELDAYYAADPCFIQRVQGKLGLIYSLSGRYRWFAKSEKAVFDVSSSCQILHLTNQDKLDFQRWYQTPDRRFHLLPPYLSAERMQLKDKAEMRTYLRQQFSFADQDNVLLMVGSGFRTKGVDRAIQAIANLPEAMRANTRLLVIGQDNPKPFQRQINELGLNAHVIISGGRADIPQLMQGADILLHPARRELAGHVLLESMASGLPVLVTGVCGYAHHIASAQAGVVMPGEFDQSVFERNLQQMLSKLDGSAWATNGIAYSKQIMSVNNGAAEAEILIDCAKRKLSRGLSSVVL